MNLNEAQYILNENGYIMESENCPLCTKGQAQILIERADGVEDTTGDYHEIRTGVLLINDSLNLAQMIDGVDSEDKYVKINYCPLCGRKL